MIFNPTHRLALTTITAIIALSQLSACVPLAIGGAAATTAIVATDRRTAGEQVDDKSIPIKISSEANQILGKRPSRLNITSYAGQVLLIGDVPTAQDSQRIEAVAKQTPQVKQVINRLRVGPVTELGVRTNDSWITTKATTALINTKDVPSRTISVTTERGVVYLQGLVTKDEGERAAQAVATVPGVTEVVKLFEYISAERVLLPQQSTTDTTITTQPNQAPAPQANEPEVFTIN